MSEPRYFGCYKSATGFEEKPRTVSEVLQEISDGQCEWVRDSSCGAKCGPMTRQKLFPFSLQEARSPARFLGMNSGISVNHICCEQGTRLVQPVTMESD